MFFSLFCVVIQWMCLFCVSICIWPSESGFSVLLKVSSFCIVLGALDMLFCGSVCCFVFHVTYVICLFCVNVVLCYHKNISSVNPSVSLYLCRHKLFLLRKVLFICFVLSLFYPLEVCYLLECNEKCVWLYFAVTNIFHLM